MQNYEIPRRQHKRNINGLGFSNNFLYMIPKAQSIKETDLKRLYDIQEKANCGDSENISGYQG